MYVLYGASIILCRILLSVNLYYYTFSTTFIIIGDTLSLPTKKKLSQPPSPANLNNIKSLPRAINTHDKCSA